MHFDEPLTVCVSFFILQSTYSYNGFQSHLYASNNNVQCFAPSISLSHPIQLPASSLHTWNITRHRLQSELELPLSAYIRVSAV